MVEYFSDFLILEVLYIFLILTIIGISIGNFYSLVNKMYLIILDFLYLFSNNEDNPCGELKINFYIMLKAILNLPGAQSIFN